MNFNKIFIGDVLLRIGSGIVGGSTVSLYYNTVVSDKQLWWPFCVGIILGFVFLGIGYCIHPEFNK